MTVAKLRRSRGKDFFDDPDWETMREESVADGPIVTDVGVDVHEPDRFLTRQVARARRGDDLRVALKHRNQAISGRSE